MKDKIIHMILLGAGIFIIGILIGSYTGGFSTTSSSLQPFIEELELQYFLNDYNIRVIEKCVGWEINYFNGSETRTIEFDTYDEIQRTCKHWAGPSQEDCVFYDEGNISWTVSASCINLEEILEEKNEKDM